MVAHTITVTNGGMSVGGVKKTKNKLLIFDLATVKQKTINQALKIDFHEKIKSKNKMSLWYTGRVADHIIVRKRMDLR